MAQLMTLCPSCGSPMWAGPTSAPQRMCWQCQQRAAVREFLPSHDPDQQDHGLALELAVDRTRDGVIDAARQICPNVDAVSGEEYIQALEDALAAYDAAVAENRAHDDRVQL